MGFDHPGFEYRKRPETGRGAPCVAAFRDEAFGPIKSNPELDDALEILARLEAQHAEVKAAQDALAARVQRLEDGMREATDRIARAGG
jgi:hypothetical protein